MSRDTPLARFVDRALAAGRPRAEIAAALRDAGWDAREVDAALAAFADTDFPVPVPRPGGVWLARDALLYGVLFVSLAVAAFELVDFANDLLARWLDPVETRVRAGMEAGGDWRRNSLMRSLASVLVFGPVYLWCDRLDRRRADPAGGDRSVVRRWVAAAIVLAAILSLLGVAVAAVQRLLMGDPTVLFLAQMLVVAAVAGGVLLRWRRA